MQLTDIYSDAELYDEEEILGLRLQEYDWRGIDLPVREMSAEEVTRLCGRDGVSTVIAIFRAFAEPWQRELVREKVRDFDAGRIIIVEGNVVVDGNHHVVAAVRKKKPIFYIDLRDC